MHDILSQKTVLLKKKNVDKTNQQSGVIMPFMHQVDTQVSASLWLVCGLLNILFIQLSSETSCCTFIISDKMSYLSSTTEFSCIYLTMTSVIYVIEILLSIFVASKIIVGYLQHILR
jgi:hypothetical protein